jgi:cytidyltransferase-like protein
MDNGKMVEHKIHKFDELREKIQTDRAKGLKVVLCYGVFDALHIGHMRYLKQAKEYGDVLVVILTAENKIEKENKQYVQSRRAEALAYLDWIDAVAINDYPNLMK